MITDPLALENVTQGKSPPEEQELTYEGKYEVGKKVTCAFGHPHKKGYVFCDERGERYLIGHQCGATHFDMGDWNTFTRGLRGLEDRAFYLHRILELRSIFNSNLDWIQSLPTEKGFNAFDRLRQDIHSRFPELVEAVQKVVHRTQGRLSLTEKVRDIDAEIRQETKEEAIAEREGRKFSPSKSPIFKYVLVDGGPLNGTSIFVPREPVIRTLDRTVHMAKAFLCHNPKIIELHDLVSITKNARQIVKNFVDARDALNDAIIFFNQDNLDRFAKWANANEFDRFNYSSDLGRIIVSANRLSKPIAITQPADLATITDERFDALDNHISHYADTLKARRRN